MRPRRDSKTRRHSLTKAKKKPLKPKIIERDDISLPEVSKVNRGYKFYIKRDAVLNKYVDILKIRYSQDRVPEYSIEWKVITNETGDKNLQVQIKVKEKKRKPISNIDVNTKPTDLQTLYVITVYYTSLVVLVQGKLKAQWINKEYPLLKAIYAYMKDEQTKTVMECYEHILDTIDQTSFKALVEVVPERGIESGGDTKYFEKTKCDDFAAHKSMEGIKKSIDAIGTRPTEARPTRRQKKVSTNVSNISKDDVGNLRVIEEAVSEMSEELMFWITTYTKDKGRLEKQLKNVIEQVIGLLIIGNRDLKNKVDGLEEALEKQKEETDELKAQNEDRKKDESEFKTIVKYLTGEMFEFRKRLDKIDESKIDNVDEVTQQTGESNKIVNGAYIDEIDLQEHITNGDYLLEKDASSNTINTVYPVENDSLDETKGEGNSWENHSPIETDNTKYFSETDSLSEATDEVHPLKQNVPNKTSNVVCPEDEDSPSDTPDEVNSSEKASPNKTTNKEDTLENDSLRKTIKTAAIHPNDSPKRTKVRKPSKAQNKIQSSEKDCPSKPIKRTASVRKTVPSEPTNKVDPLGKHSASKDADSPIKPIERLDSWEAASPSRTINNADSLERPQLIRMATDVNFLGKDASHKAENGEQSLNCDKIGENNISKSNSQEDIVSPEDDTAKLLVLMGSNRKYAPLHRLFPNKTITVIPCISNTVAKNILNSYRMEAMATHNISLDSTDTEDFEINYPETIADELSNIAKEFIESFQCKTYVSTLTTEKNNLQELVRTANTLLQQTTGQNGDDNIILITPEKLNGENMNFYKKHKTEGITNRPPNNYVSGIEVLYMNLHSPQLDKILQKYLEEENGTTEGTSISATSSDEASDDARNKMASIHETIGSYPSGLETAV